MKIKQTLIKTLMITIVAILGISASMPIFATGETRNLSLSTFRYIDGESTNKAYKLNIKYDSLNHTIYQIKAENGDTNYYCLNAEAGTHWKRGEEALYNKSYDLDDKSKREELFNDTKAVLTSSGKENITQILWILENMYISNSRFYVGTAQEKAAQRLEQKNALLAKAGLVLDTHDDYGHDTGIYRYKYVQQPGFDNYYNEIKYGTIISNGTNVEDGYIVNNKPIEFTDELVEVAQQAALWYFTNFDKNAPEDTIRYNVREYGLQLLQQEGTSAWQVLTAIKEGNVEIGKMKQDMATILCWYLIDAAEKYAKEVKDLPEIPSGNPLTITPLLAAVTEKSVNNNNYYVVGPIKIEENREAVYSLNDTIYINEDSTTGAYISDEKTKKLKIMLKMVNFI